jgi:hypothetical protein
MAHSHRLSTLIIISGIAPTQNAFKSKIASHKQKSIVNIFFDRKMGPLASEALCLSTHKHNGKSGTVGTTSSGISYQLRDIYNIGVLTVNIEFMWGMLRNGGKNEL